MQSRGNKPNGTGLKRIYYATRCSLFGFKAAWRFESAFRQELLMCAGLFPLSFVLASSTQHWVLLIASLLFVLFAEMFNSAIEAVCDAVTVDNHPLIGRAKDMGSSAVMISLCVLGLVWFEAGFQYINQLERFGGVAG